jgi:hypothetical protein
MPAPKGVDGIIKALEVIGIPSIGILVGVVLVEEYYGGIAAGLLYLGATAVILGGIYLSAKYWNIVYAGGFAIAGLFIWATFPGAISQTLPKFFGINIFGVLGMIVKGVFLIAMLLLFKDKVS